jgi:hypothetical protein
MGYVCVPSGDIDDCCVDQNVKELYEDNTRAIRTSIAKTSLLETNLFAIGREQAGSDDKATKKMVVVVMWWCADTRS